jgi:death-on-curing protein
MRYLAIEQVVALHRLVCSQSGGSVGIRDMNALEAAVAQPAMTFGGVDLYPSLAEKAAALAYSLIQNHPFIDGNKRIGHAAMEVFLVLNGYEVDATVDEQEGVFLAVASGRMTRAELANWLAQHIIRRSGGQPA